MVLEPVFSSVKIQKHDHGFRIDYFHNEESESKKLRHTTGRPFESLLIAAFTKKELALASEPKMLALRVKMNHLVDFPYCDVR